MKINIKTVNIALTPAIEDYLQKRLMSLDKLVEFDRDNVLVQAELGKTTEHHKGGDYFRAEVNLHIGGRSFRAVSETSDLYSAIDDMKDELFREIVSGKEKRQSVFRRSAHKLKDLMRFSWKRRQR